jgi:D-xylose transport system permease protein
MSESLAQLPDTSAPPVGAAMPGSIGEAWNNYRGKIRNGDLGSLPAVFGIVLLVAIFGIAEPSLIGASSLQSVLEFAAPAVVLAMGLVFVLLLGEIDLSAGVVGSTAACFGVYWTYYHGWSWWEAILAAMVFGTACGVVLGWLRARLGIPSFVVTLAAFISFQGVQIFLADTKAGGLLENRQPILGELISGRLSKLGSWVFLAVLVIIYVAVKYAQRADRVRQGLSVEAPILLILRIAGLIVLGGLFTWACNLNTLASWQAAKGLYSGGEPWSVPIIAFLVIAFTFMLSKTRYGRHIYAVGGNNEAARRAGIPVVLIRTSVFVICSGLAAVSGLLLAAQENQATDSQGLGNTLLLGVAAAVIGGTSLMGGRGRVVDAVLGGVALTILSFGMSDLISGASNGQWEDIITGIVLLIAAWVDAASRHAGRQSG